MAAMEIRTTKLQESQCKLENAMNMLVNSNTSKLEGSGVPPIIETKLGITTTTTGADLASLMATNSAN